MGQITDYKAFADKQQYLSELVLEYSKIMLDLEDEDEEQYAKEISEKIASENFEIAVVGSFKNGKSTFINALLGKEILPAYARPCTAIINEVRYGKKEAATIFLKDNLSEEQLAVLPEWIKNEMSSYDNTIGINVPMKQLNEVLTIPMGEEQEGFETPYSKMVLYYPLELLKNHVIITDTPGLNEVETRTRITTNHLNKADAIIMVFSADKLCSRVEMIFVEDDLKSNGFLSPFFVVNRMDTLRNEREIGEIKQLASNKLTSYTQKGKDGIYYISAIDALDVMMDSDDEMLEKSGFPAFEKALATYLINERGRDKLIPSAELISSKIEKDVLLEIIPKKIKGLNMGLQDAIIRQVNSQESLKKAKESKDRIAEIISKNSLIYLEDLSQLIDNFYMDIVKKAAFWIDSYTPKAYDELKPKKKAEAIKNEILDYVSSQIKEYFTDWQQNTYKVAVMQKIELLNELIRNDLEEFLKEIKNSQTTFFGDDEITNTETLVESSFSVDSIVNNELFKNIGASLGIALGAGILVELLTGLMNPILGVITAIGAIVIGIANSSKKIVPEVKEAVKKGVTEKLSSIGETSSKKMRKETQKIFDDYKNQILKALDKKYTQAKKEIDTVVETLKKDAAEIEKKKIELSNLSRTTCDLLNKIQTFIGEV